MWETQIWEKRVYFGKCRREHFNHILEVVFFYKEGKGEVNFIILSAVRAQMGT
jgi:hypothetical protein